MAEAKENNRDVNRDGVRGDWGTKGREIGDRHANTDNGKEQTLKHSPVYFTTAHKSNTKI